MEVGIYLTDTTVSKSLLSAEFVFTLVEFNSAIAIFVVCNLVRLRFGDIHLNAANSAMQRGDLVSAGRFLRKAGNSNEARYAQGLLAALNKDYDTAIATMKILQNAMPQAQQMLQQLQAIKAWQGK